MQHTQSIGTLAENIIAVSFRIDGTVTPIIRHREPTGRMVDAPCYGVSRCPSEIDFVARVKQGDSAVAGINPEVWRGNYAIAVVPLGHPQGAMPLPASADAALTPGGGPDEIRFRLADGKLTWRSENLSGETVLDETFPELTVTLRLPPGNDGAIEFATPLFTNAEGEQIGVLAVA